MISGWRFSQREIPFAVIMIRLVCLPLALFFSASSLQAQFELPGNSAASRARMVSEAKTIAAGSSFSVALQFEHPAGWHSYYRNSGGIEQGLVVDWKLPEGFTAGPVQWPVPTVKDGYFGKSFIHEDSPVFLTEIKAPAGLQPGQTVTLSAHAAWQICKESCLNEEASFTLDLTTGEELVKDPAEAEVFAAARASQPAAAEGWSFEATREGGDILLRVVPAGGYDGEPADFVPDQPFVKSASSGGSIRREGDAWLIRLPGATENAIGGEIAQGDEFSGVLTGARPVAVPMVRIAAAEPEPLPLAGYLRVLGGMFLGGLILNLMPCVFPVIGLKIMGFVQQAGAERRKVVLHGLVFTLGVLVSFLVLSGILFAVRQASGGGNQIGWGYQLEDPRVVLALMLLMFLLALNMFGVFEIGASATSVGGTLLSKQGFGGSFFSGVLATVVATPCSAPFLGAAIGAAIALPPVRFFASFMAMGLGLALPYLVLSAFPKLIDFLPRPGAWMESFKQAMSFLLFATAGYLLWVYAGQIGLENLLGPIFGLSAIAVAAWVYGRWNLPHRKTSTRMMARIAVVLFAVAGLLLAKPPQTSALKWEPWSEARVEALLEEGRPVYIDFTAQWCATCQLNKKRAYTPEVIALMKEKRVVALRADKTVRDPAIDAALQRLGRSAIPVNVLLAPGREPLILPELLSPEAVKEALQSL
jgi:thiol:disulfide interchange protein DsbD